MEDMKRRAKRIGLKITWVLITLIAFLIGGQYLSVTEIVSQEFGWTQLNAVLILCFSTLISILILAGILRLVFLLARKNLIRSLAVIAETMAYRASHGKWSKEKIEAHTESLLASLKLLGRTGLIIFLTSLASIFLLCLFNMADFVGRRLQLNEMQIQNRAVSRQNDIAEAQQIFELTMQEAERASNEIADVLLNPKSSLGQQVSALRQLPDVMVMPVIVVGPENDLSSTTGDFERVVKFPNVQRLQRVLRLYMSEDRRANTYMESLGQPPEVGHFGRFRKLSPLQGVSNTLLLTIWAMGPNEEGDLCLWNWVPEEHYSLKDYKDGVIPPQTRKEKYGDKYNGDLLHVAPDEWNGIQLPFLNIKPARFWRFRSHSNFGNAQLQGAHLPLASLPHSSFRHAALDEANLDGVDLRSASLIDCTFNSAKLSRGNLSRAKIAACEFKNSLLLLTDFTACSMVNCDFSSANGQLNSFAGGSASLVKFNWADLGDANFEGAKLERCDFSNAYLKRFKCLGVNASDCLFIGTEMEGGDLRFSSFRNSNFSAASLQEADLRATDLSSAHFGKMTPERKIESTEDKILCVYGPYKEFLDSYPGSIVRIPDGLDITESIPVIEMEVSSDAESLWRRLQALCLRSGDAVSQKLKDRVKSFNYVSSRTPIVRFHAADLIKEIKELFGELVQPTLKRTTFVSPKGEAIVSRADFNQVWIDRRTKEQILNFLKNDGNAKDGSKIIAEELSKVTESNTLIADDPGAKNRSKWLNRRRLWFPGGDNMPKDFGRLRVPLRPIFSDTNYTKPIPVKITPR